MATIELFITIYLLLFIIIYYQGLLTVIHSPKENLFI